MEETPKNHDVHKIYCLLNLNPPQEGSAKSKKKKEKKSKKKKEKKKKAKKEKKTVEAGDPSSDSSAVSC